EQKTAYELATCLEFRRVLFRSGSLLDDDTSAGAGSFTFVGPPNPSTGNPNTLTGTGSSPGVAAGQVVTLPSGAYLHVGSVTNAEIGRASCRESGEMRVACGCGT